MTDEPLKARIARTLMRELDLKMVDDRVVCAVLEAIRPVSFKARKIVNEFECNLIMGYMAPHEIWARVIDTAYEGL